MDNIKELLELSNQIQTSMPCVIHGITSEEEHASLVELMDVLIEDYDTNKNLINLLFSIIERYEQNAEQFNEFNNRLEKLDDGIAVLRTLMDQYNLDQSSFKNEIGGKSLVSQILSGKRNLTIKHIAALSERFNIPSDLFIKHR